jgi:hypothetical protein
MTLSPGRLLWSLIPFTDRGLFPKYSCCFELAPLQQSSFTAVGQIILTLGDLGFVTAFGPIHWWDFLLPRG